jgi:cation diffusion facilitator CzcD-associated flavoprotein CzcO
MSAYDRHVVIIGTGFAGLAMGIKLKKAGFDDFTILERSSDVGGTWRDNHYPGAACDVPSHLYSFSFEPNRRWSRKFSPQKEILEYLRHCARKYGLMPHIRFNSNVEGARYDEDAGLWSVKTQGGAEYKGRVLINATGGLSRPVYPDIRGLRDFKGELFHSAEWNHSAPLDGKTIAVIGTGASAIQIVPALAPKAARLELFQRSAAWILPKFDAAYTPREMYLKTKVPGWERLMRLAIFWRLEFFGLGLRHPGFMEYAKKVFLRHLETSIKDPVLREKLTPSYLPGCKRILLSDDFYRAVSRDNVDVVTAGISHVDAKGIVTKDGAHHPVDAIICATGFQASESAAPYPIVGRRGRILNDVWQAGAEAYRGTTVAGFPNFFMLVGPNTGLGHTSMVLMIESQVRYTFDAIQQMTARRLKSVDVDPMRQSAYNERLTRMLDKMVWSKGGCVSWYQTSTGKNTTLWPRSTVAFRMMTLAFDLRDYQFESLMSDAAGGLSENLTSPGQEQRSA